MKIGDKGQVVIPAEIRRRAGLEPGQRVEIEEHNGVLTITPIPRDLIGYMTGLRRGRRSPLQDLLKEHAEEVRRDEKGGL